MINLGQFIHEKLLKIPSFRLRSKLTFYASDAGKCTRDLYWEKIGEPRTNPTDVVGQMRLDFGTGIEKVIVEQWLQKMHVFGVHLVATQVAVGGTDPDWNGYIDAIVGERDANGNIHTFLVEIKTKWGKGASWIMQDRKPSEDYLAQLGLYLKDFYDKGKPKEGCILYYLISDNPDVNGQLMQFNCRYLPETEEIQCYQLCTSYGLIESNNIRVSIRKVLDKFNRVIDYVARGEVPPPDFVYKRALTDEMLTKLSDYEILAAVNGQKIIGDWQVTYSPFKNKIFETDGISPSYTTDEIAKLQAEYRRRHPRTKKF